MTYLHQLDLQGDLGRGPPPAAAMRSALSSFSSAVSSFRRGFPPADVALARASALAAGVSLPPRVVLLSAAQGFPPALSEEHNGEANGERERGESPTGRGPSFWNDWAAARITAI